MSTVTVPAALVDVLRESLVIGLAGAAEDIAEAGRTPSRFDVKLLEPFDAYRALGVVGLTRAVGAVQVEVDLSVHRWALVWALRERSEHERYMLEVDAETPRGAAQQRRARRNAKRIEAFVAGAGLDDGAAPEGPVT